MKYFMQDYNGKYQYATLNEALAAANDSIGDGSEGWNDENLNAIIVGLNSSCEITHRPKQFDRKERPDEDELDSDCCDEEGTYWGEWYYRCKYKMEEIIS